MMNLEDRNRCVTVRGPQALKRRAGEPLTWGFVGPVGLEPTTRGLKVRCSAN
jgi:hypothetical protein